MWLEDLGDVRATVGEEEEELAARGHCGAMEKDLADASTQFARTRFPGAKKRHLGEAGLPSLGQIAQCG
jgi:hypothetical protein